LESKNKELEKEIKNIQSIIIKGNKKQKLLIT